YEMVSVARGVFDKQIAAAGNRDAADADLAVADVEIPAVEVDIDAIEPAVFETEVLVEIGSEHSPGDPAAFGSQISKRAMEHPCAGDSIGAGGNVFSGIGSVLFPWHRANVFERDIVDAVE